MIYIDVRPVKDMGIVQDPPKKTRCETKPQSQTPLQRL